MARSENLLAYGDNVDIAGLAASYAYGIAKNRPFIDGSKRTSLVVMRTFLAGNGVELTASREEKYLTFLRLAEGTITEEELAEWVRDRIPH